MLFNFTVDVTKLVNTALSVLHSMYVKEDNILALVNGSFVSCIGISILKAPMPVYQMRQSSIPLIPFYDVVRFVQPYI